MVSEAGYELAGRNSPSFRHGPIANSDLAAVQHAQARLATIRADISGRLWLVNQGMSSDEFNALMDQMALLQFNFERRDVDREREVERRLGRLDRRLRQ